MQNTNNYYDNLISNLDDIDCLEELDEEQLISIKEKMKSVESKLKEKIKPKTITISGPTHNKIKRFCIQNEETIGDWCEKTLLLGTEKQPTREDILLGHLENYKKGLVDEFNNNDDLRVMIEFVNKKESIENEIENIKQHVIDVQNKIEFYSIKPEKYLENLNVIVCDTDCVSFTTKEVDEFFDTSNFSLALKDAVNRVFDGEMLVDELASEDDNLPIYVKVGKYDYSINMREANEIENIVSIKPEKYLENLNVIVCDTDCVSFATKEVDEFFDTSNFSLALKDAVNRVFDGEMLVDELASEDDNLPIYVKVGKYDYSINMREANEIKNIVYEDIKTKQMVASIENMINDINNNTDSSITEIKQISLCKDKTII